MKKKSIRCYGTMIFMIAALSMTGCAGSQEKEEIKEISVPEEQETTEKVDTAMPSETPVPAKGAEEEMKVQETEAQKKEEYTTNYIVNCKESVSMHVEPDVTSEDPWQVPLGAEVSLVENTGNGFCKIIYGGNTGYVFSAYLSKEKPAAAQPEVEPAPIQPAPAQTAPIQFAPVQSADAQPISYVTYYVVNCNESITLRPAPNVNSGEICQIPLGSAVSFVETAANGFYKIIYNGNTGYSLASYLSTEKADSAPVKNTVSSSYDTYYVSYCSQSITLRSAPDVYASEICQISLGSAVGVVQAADNGFYYVQYNGNFGYALASFLKSGSGWSIYDICQVVNCNESITLRPGPYVESGEIRQIPLGENVTYIGNAGNGFYEIFYMGDHGYAMADYLAFV